jgi:hypothetical protein
VKLCTCIWFVYIQYYLQRDVVLVKSFLFMDNFANSVLLVAKGGEVGRQHDLLFLFLLVLGGSGGSGGTAPRVTPRSGPGGGGGCTMRVPTRSRTLKKKIFCVVTSAVLCIRDVHILDPGSAFFHLGSQIQGPKDPGSRSAIKEFKYY